MRILVGWDNAQQAELVSMYLGAGDHVAIVAIGKDELLTLLDSNELWDIVLLSVNLPDIDSGFETFTQIRQLRPELSVVGACFAADVYRVIRFMTHGMAAYVIRDGQGDYLFMLLSVLESARDAVRAMRDQQLAEKLREEVRAVRKLQESMIPSKIIAPEGCSIVARYEPSQIRVTGGKSVTMAGGDYYDVFNLDDNNVVFLVGDASGHGMKAAMCIMVLHTLVRMIQSQRYQKTSTFIAAINNQLCQHSVVTEDGGFITLFYGLLQLDKNELHWTSSGHPIPLIQDMETGEIRALEADSATGLPLAIYPDVEYDTYTCKLPDKYRLLFYSDGLQEAFPENELALSTQFGVEGISNSLRDSKQSTLQDAMNLLFDRSEAFTKGAGRHDDTSVVLLERG